MAHRLVHLDLKGAAPKPEFFKHVFPRLVDWGATGLLIEWEDAFPFNESLEIIHNKVYTYDDAMQITQDAKTAGLEVIPLVQTFGHLEFMLKHNKYFKFREVPLFPSSLCPSAPGVLDLLTLLLEQIMTFHVGTKYIHIGADEVWHMGYCSRCEERLNSGESKEDLFLKHLRAIAEIVKQRWPGVCIIMWDDMLREMDEATIANYNLRHLVEPMIWHYNAAADFNLPLPVLRKYNYFDHVWAAGAFKGATGASQLLPVVQHHVSNIMHWACMLEQLKTDLRGFVFTGWSRYDHYAALCELLPVSLTSLGACLTVWRERTFSASLICKLETALEYHQAGPPTPDRSRELYLGVARVVKVRENALSVLNSDHLRSWMNQYQIAHSRVNPMQIVSLIPSLNSFILELNELEKHMRTHLSVVYHETTVEEWVGTHIAILRSDVQKTLDTCQQEVAKASKLVEDINEMDC